MKKALKLVGLIVLLLLLLPAGGLTFLALKPPKGRPPSAEKVDVSPERLARGKYLAEHVSACVDCHSQREEGLYAMPIRAEALGAGGSCLERSTGFPGRVCPKNITPDTSALGGWTDGEIIRAIREGLSRDGRALFPMMPYASYRHMSDEDVRAVVAYLRTLAPVAHTPPPTELDFPLNLFIKLVPQPLEGPVPAPPASDRLAYGKYLFTLAACGECHTPRDERGEPIEGMELAGGVEMRGPWGRVVTANITPDPDTGIGHMTRDVFIGRFKAFASMEKTPAAPGRNTVMPWIPYSGMTEEDLGAIYEYLRTIKPVKNKVEHFPGAEG